MIPTEDSVALGKEMADVNRPEPSAPPLQTPPPPRLHTPPPPPYDAPPSYEEIWREERNNLDTNRERVPVDNIPMNIQTEENVTDRKLRPNDPQQQSSYPEGPWKSADIGEAVDDSKDPILTKRKRRRKVKKALGWVVWVVLPPVALAANCMRESPLDPIDDPYDKQDDPLRPWNYNIHL